MRGPPLRDAATARLLQQRVCTVAPLAWAPQICRCCRRRPPISFDDLVLATSSEHVLRSCPIEIEPRGGSPRRRQVSARRRRALPSRRRCLGWVRSHPRSSSVLQREQQRQPAAPEEASADVAASDRDAGPASRAFRPSGAARTPPHGIAELGCLTAVAPELLGVSVPRSGPRRLGLPPPPIEPD